MNYFKVFWLLFIVNFLAGCSATYNAKYDYDQQTSFVDFKTYDWIKKPDEAGTNPFLLQRVKTAVESELQTKGLTAVSNNPDFLIAVHLGKKDKVEVTGYGYDYPPNRSFGGFGGLYRGDRHAYTREYVEGTLILDFVDGQSKKLIWRGSINATLDAINNPEKNNKLIHEAVTTILEKYPPPSSK